MTKFDVSEEYNGSLTLENRWVWPWGAMGVPTLPLIFHIPIARTSESHWSTLGARCWAGEGWTLWTSYCCFCGKKPNPKQLSRASADQALSQGPCPLSQASRQHRSTVSFNSGPVDSVPPRTGPLHCAGLWGSQDLLHVGSLECSVPGLPWLMEARGLPAKGYLKET